MRNKIIVVAFSCIGFTGLFWSLSSSSDITVDRHSEHEEHTDSKTNTGAHSDHDEHEGHGSSKHENKRAVMDVSNGGAKFKLSDAAHTIINPQIAYLKKSGNKQYTIPRQAVLYYQAETGVYILDTGWFRLVDVVVKKIEKDVAVITSPYLESKKAIVVSGVGFLRVAHLEALGEMGEGHAH